MEQKKTLTLSECAEYIGCTPPTLRKMIKDEKAPPYMIFGKSKRWSVAQVDAWLSGVGR